MKKILVLFVVLILTACHSIKYTHSGNVNSRLDFKKGKWLLHTVEAPKSIKESLTNIANEKFIALLGNRFSDVNTTRGILLPANITTNLNKTDLRDIKNGTGYDFFIKINATVISDEVGDLEIGKVISSVENIGEIRIDIYDLNLLDILYSQSVIGRMHISESNDNLAFSTSTNNIIIKGFKRIMKNIHENQIKN
ncbi:hypothetical protein [Tenacibaculum insulae]|uniref:hypothetical protein n=1 Tax=Tenacibaculum insulae TaxID=2029677 RepID=UPI003AB52EAC